MSLGSKNIVLYNYIERYSVIFESLNFAIFVTNIHTL